MTQLIAFTGLKNSGKDTAAGALVRNLGFIKIAFAEPIKFMLAELMVRRGCPQALITDFLDGERKEEPTHYLMGQTPRHAMQTLGTEWGRTCIKEGIWIDTFMRRAERCIDAGDNIVVTDVRFPNEVAAIHELGGKVYRINRPGTKATDHASEAQVIGLKVDGEIDNIQLSAPAFASWVREHFQDQFVG